MKPNFKGCLFDLAQILNKEAPNVPSPWQHRQQTVGASRNKEEHGPFSCGGRPVDHLSCKAPKSNRKASLEWRTGRNEWREQQHEIRELIEKNMLGASTLDGSLAASSTVVNFCTFMQLPSKPRTVRVEEAWRVFQNKKRVVS
ncbi:unnamed protein product [Calypogeia fissa]